MRFISTGGQPGAVTLREAAFKGLAPDGGLYVPETLSPLPASFFKELSTLSLPEMATVVAANILGDSLPEAVLQGICEEAFNFPVPLAEVTPGRYLLELFHGPSYAFKDFGARFMARLLAYYLEQEARELHVLVATSGDTGGAVALGFLNVPGIKVSILYPSGKVSGLQEKQLTTLGGNITALEVDGNFDDCQRIVKAAFNDAELSRKHGLTSANSINICRLVPQSFYYFHACAQLAEAQLPVVFSVPSGNFGNLCAGLLAKRIGLPVDHFVAATNANDVFVKYLESGNYNARPSVRTLSNAMDVGDPSNYARIAHLYNYDFTALRKDVFGHSVSDAETTACIERVFAEHNYLLEPHAAVAWLGLEAYEKTLGRPFVAAALGTAHPAKFMDVIPAQLAEKIVLPAGLQDAMQKEKKSIKIKPEFAELKAYLEG
ncbi:MAG: threonine synthase [Bacteroidota bacterium]